MLFNTCSVINVLDLHVERIFYPILYRIYLVCLKKIRLIQLKHELSIMTLVKNWSKHGPLLPDTIRALIIIPFGFFYAAMLFSIV